MIIIINLIGLLLLGFIVWWFWLGKSSTKNIATATNGVIDIVVENGVYNPAVIAAKAGEKLNLRFIRKDSTPCAEVVVFPQLDVSNELPLNKPQLISVEFKQPGEYDFTCQMAMYRGKVIVK